MTSQLKGQNAGQYTSGGFTVRPMEPEDIHRVLVIERAVFSQPWSRSHFEEHLGYRPLAQAWLVEREEGIVGFLLAWYIAIYAEGTGEVHILNIAVKSEWQRQGIGAQLLKRAVQHGLEIGCDTATLEVRESNTVAQNFYKTFGFQVIGNRRNYYGNEDALLMKASLRKVFEAISAGV